MKYGHAFLCGSALSAQYGGDAVYHILRGAGTTKAFKRAGLHGAFCKLATPELAAGSAVGTRQQGCHLVYARVLLHLEAATCTPQEDGAKYTYGCDDGNSDEDGGHGKVKGADTSYLSANLGKKMRNCNRTEGEER